MLFQQIKKKNALGGSRDFFFLGANNQNHSISLIYFIWSIQNSQGQKKGHLRLTKQIGTPHLGYSQNHHLQIAVVAQQSRHASPTFRLPQDICATTYVGGKGGGVVHGSGVLCFWKQVHLEVLPVWSYPLTGLGKSIYWVLAVHRGAYQSHHLWLFYLRSQAP